MRDGTVDRHKRRVKEPCWPDKSSGMRDGGTEVRGADLVRAAPLSTPPTSNWLAAPAGRQPSRSVVPPTLGSKLANPTPPGGVVMQMQRKPRDGSRDGTAGIRLPTSRW